MDSNHIFTTTWSYNNAGHIAQIGYPSGLKVRYAWQTGRIASLDAWLNGAWKRVASYAYQPGGTVASIWYGNGLVQNRLHDDDGRLTGINTASWQHLSYSYDAANRITAIASSGAGNGWSRTYQYDADNRLIGVGPSQQSFAYDANGNRTQHIFGGATSSYHRASGSNRLVSITGARARSFQHDAVGRRAQETVNGITTTYTWGAFGRLTQASRPSAVAVCKANGICPTLPAGSWSYLTNGLDQRVEKRPAGQGAVRYTFTPNGTLLSQTWLGRLSPGKQYIWANGMPVGLVQGGSLYFISSDHLGRPELVTNTAGSRVWQANNGAFDRKVHVNGIGSLNIGFPGQYYQSELGQWYNGHRMYDATTGSYTTSDPLGLAAGTNTYAYVGNNPLANVDPLGLCKHHYQITVHTACSAADAFKKLEKPGMSAPGAPQAHAGFSPVVVLTGDNLISQRVNQESMTIVNTTLRQHIFYNGSVTMHVTTDPTGSGSILSITGRGNDVLPIPDLNYINNGVGYAYFGSVAALVKMECAVESLSQ